MLAVSAETAAHLFQSYQQKIARPTFKQKCFLVMTEVKAIVTENQAPTYDNKQRYKYVFAMHEDKNVI